MTPVSRIITFRANDEMRAAMEALRQRDGIPYSEQLRRAMREWLVMKGVMEAERKRVAPRKRP